MAKAPDQGGLSAANKIKLLDAADVLEAGGYNQDAFQLRKKAEYPHWKVPPGVKPSSKKK